MPLLADFDGTLGTAEEPESGTTVSVPITVIRTGGTLGVVGVTWMAVFTGWFQFFHCRVDRFYF